MKILYSALAESETGEERVRRLEEGSREESARNAGPESMEESIRNAAVMGMSTWGGRGRKAYRDGVEGAEEESDMSMSMNVSIRDSSCNTALLHSARLLLIPRVAAFIRSVQAEILRIVSNTKKSDELCDVRVAEYVPCNAAEVCKNNQPIVPNTMSGGSIAFRPAGSSSSTPCPSSSVMKGNMSCDLSDSLYGLSYTECATTDLSVSFTVACKDSDGSSQSPYAYYFEVSIDGSSPCSAEILDPDPNPDPNPIISMSMKRRRRRRRTDPDSETVHTTNPPNLREITQLEGSGEREADIGRSRVMELFQTEILRTSRR